MTPASRAIGRTQATIDLAKAIAKTQKVIVIAASERHAQELRSRVDHAHNIEVISKNRDDVDLVGARVLGSYCPVVVDHLTYEQEIHQLLIQLRSAERRLQKAKEALG